MKPGYAMIIWSACAIISGAGCDRIDAQTTQQAKSQSDAQKQAVDPRSAAGMFEAGHDIFSRYEASDAERMKGWQLMLDAAKAGDLNAKKRVADYAAGFLSLNMDPETKTAFKPNVPLALEYYRELVKRGGVESRVRLAQLYSSGIGEAADESESPHNLLIGAAAKGNKEAMTLLGERYLYGHGEDKDVIEAARWEYLASVNSEQSSHWVDLQGAPRIQDTPEQDEMAKILSLFYKVGKSRDAVAMARLKSMYGAAAKPFNPDEIVQAAKQPTNR
jgi:TPR repeat protein